MSRKLKKEQVTEYRQANSCLRMVRWVIDIYLFLLICIYPFLIRRGYGSTSHIKYNFLIGISYFFRLGSLPVPTFIPVSSILIIAGTYIYIRDTGKTFTGFIKEIRLSATDKAVLVYVSALILSSMVSSHKDELIWGYPTWNMGLASQFLLILLYFIISRFFDVYELELITYAAMLATTPVFLIEILQRFGADIFNLYNGVEDKISYISTIGQVSWFSAYMILFVCMSTFIVWYFDSSSRIRKAGAAHLFIGSVSLVTQNTDSAYAGLFIFLTFIFVWSFDDNKRMKSFLETALIILLSWRVTGFMQLVFKDRMIGLDPLSIFMSQGIPLWGLILFIAVLYIFIGWKEKKDPDFDISRYSAVGRIFVLTIFVVTVLMIIYIVLNTTEVLPEKYRSTNNYLLFNDYWGNLRGAMWRDTVNSYFMELKAEPLKAIFGAGADQFYHVLSDYTKAHVTPIWGDTVATNAHNEWLTAFVNYGVYGGLAYMGIFITSIIRCSLMRHRVPYAMAVAGIVAAYMAHNIFCYQQYICAPYLFVIMAAGEQMTRIGYKGLEDV